MRQKECQAEMREDRSLDDAERATPQSLRHPAGALVQNFYWCLLVSTVAGEDGDGQVKHLLALLLFLLKLQFFQVILLPQSSSLCSVLPLGS